MKHTTTPRIFPKLPRITAAEREIIKTAIGNDKYSRRWLKTGPAEHLVQHALEMSTSRKESCITRRKPSTRKTPHTDVETNLVSYLTKLLRSRIAAKRESLK